MKRIQIIVLLALILILGGAFYWLTKDNEVSVVQEDKTTLSPTQVESIENIGQWEFLSVSDEELIDTIRREQNPRAHFARLEVGAVNEISDYEVGNDTYKLCRKNNKRDSDKIEPHNFVEKLRLITVDKTYRKVDAHHAKGVNPHIPRKA